MKVIPQKKTEYENFINTYQHIKSLVTKPSVTPDDQGCQHYISEKLTDLGFHCHHFHTNGVSNLIATIGQGTTRIAFAGHTDVVPPGNLALWQEEPFSAAIVGDVVYGRGIADMKGGIAAMLSATEQIIHTLNLTDYQFMFLITSDEEGEAEFGTKSIVEYLTKQHLLPHLCIVGEPSASEQTGDVIKVGRRGAISAELTVTGKQGHVAYPQFADNAAHMAADIASWLNHLSWDEGSDDFPGTSLQITALDSGDWTDNIIPGQCQLSFNIRYSHKYNQQAIQERISNGLAQLPYTIEIEWLRPCLPYFTDNNYLHNTSLISAAEQAIVEVCHTFPRLSTSGGTSDGRFLASEHCQVVELGVPNKTIHQINERVPIKDLITLEAIYCKLLANLMPK